MLYVNKKTGLKVEVNSKILGDWIPANEVKEEPKKPKRRKKKDV